MSKLATNTFSEGMIKDLHPLTTPSNVLTNCLNGTLITYNGNEYVLLNDMGNGKVGTAYLAKGYVPVGMVESGGIIYVASHNPITGKSQIGSFPSPQLLFNGQDLNLEEFELSLSLLISTYNGVPVVTNEYYKQKLYQVKNSETYKEFHPGDRFILCGTLSDEIIKAVNNGFITLRLGVVNTSGYIDYIEEGDLREFTLTASDGTTCSTFIYPGDGDDSTDIEDYLLNDSIIQVFCGKSSGLLVLVVQLNTLDTFDLIRKYSSDEDENISVTFTGKATGHFEGSTTDTPLNIALYDYINSNSTDKIVITGKSDPKSYSIAPACMYGILERFKKLGTINFDDIRKNQETFSEWRFFVSSSYVKIGWGYDYYNLNEDKDIDHMLFSFYDVTRGPEVDPVMTKEMYKEYYNGNFEDTFYFGTIQKNMVYVVRIQKVVGNETSDVAWRLLYTGTYFNDYYDGTLDFNSIDRPIETLTIELSVEQSVKLQSTSYSYKSGYNEESAPAWTDTNKLQASLFYAESDGTEETLLYLIRKNGTYDVNIVPTATLSELNATKFVGHYEESDILSDFYKGIASNSTDSSAVTLSGTPVIGSVDDVVDEVNLSYTDGNITGTVKTTRGLETDNDEPKTRTGSVEHFEPFYKPESADSTDIVGFQDDESTFTSMGASNKGFCTNITTLWSNNERLTTDLGTRLGTNQSGLLLCALATGSQIVHVWQGVEDDDASLRVPRLRKSPFTPFASTLLWSLGKNEVDAGANWAGAIWKHSDGQYYPINLFTPITNNNIYSRVTTILKEIIGLMLVVKRTTVTGTFIGPSQADYVYQLNENTSTTIKLNTTTSETPVEVPIYIGSNNTTLDEYISKWSQVVNFTPKFLVSYPTNGLDITIEYGDDLDISSDSKMLSILNGTATGTVSGGEELTDAERKKIYLADPESISFNKGSLTLTVEPDSDGNYKRSSTNSSITLFDSSGTRTSVALRTDINSMFVTLYAKDELTGEVPQDYFNAILVKAVATPIGTTRWTKGSENPAGPYWSNMFYSSQLSLFEFDKS